MDPEKNDTYLQDPQWSRFSERLAPFEPKENPKQFGEAVGNSFSGSERNRFFLQQGGNFDEATLVSGLDFKEDGRGFATLDFDQDGYIDIGLISTQRPRFRLLKNEIAQRAKELGGGEKPNNSISVLLIGGNQSAEPKTEWSSRNPYGAKIIARCGDAKRIFQLSCGEGLSSQNSDRIHIGLGTHAQVDELEIVWPSGKTNKRSNITAGSRISVFENPDENEK